LADHPCFRFVGSGIVLNDPGSGDPGPAIALDQQGANAGTGNLQSEVFDEGVEPKWGFPAGVMLHQNLPRLTRTFQMKQSIAKISQPEDA
jgi:hypothetical protein